MWPYVVEPIVSLIYFKLLLGTLRRVRENQGSLRLVCNVRPVLRVLGLTGLDRLLAIHPNEESALRDLPRND